MPISRPNSNTAFFINILEIPNNLIISQILYSESENMSIAHVSDKSFQSDVIESGVPVLVDFWAEWCSPCKMIGPILEELAPEYEGRVNIAKIDVDANPKTPQQYGIRSIPTLILFKNGVVEAQQVGAVSKKQLAEFLEKNL